MILLTSPPTWFSAGYIAIAALLAAFPVLGAAQCVRNPIILSDYGVFGGTVINQSATGLALPHEVDAWLGIPYASQPIGEDRFRPVSWPAPFEGIRLATQKGPVCVQRPSARALNQSEACLYLNVYRPRGQHTAKLPVLVFLHGGSFNLFSSDSFDGPSFISRSQVPIMVVTVNYRLGALGFPSSPLFEQEGLLNLGLLDQQQALRFVAKHIASFGGDPEAVTLGGLSAGGHSVGIHLFNNDTEQLFARAWLQSGSVTARAFPSASYPLYQRQFDEFLALTGCGGLSGNDETLTCLRNAPVKSLRNATTEVFNKYDPARTWPWQPVHGGSLFEQPGSISGIQGRFHRVPVITTTTSDEGKEYVPTEIETNEGYLQFMKGVAPGLTDEDLKRMHALYPDPATDSSSPYVSSLNSTQFDRLAATWGDYAYLCPSRETAYRISRAGVPVWKLRWNAANGTPAWKGVPHTADMRYSWADPDAAYPAIGSMYLAYLASFVTTGDPNKHRLPGTPVWPQWDDGLGADDEDHECAALRVGPRQLVMQPGGAQVENDDIRTEQCLYWRDPERAKRLDK